jgi:hypothetical protein
MVLTLVSGAKKQLSTLPHLKTLKISGLFCRGLFLQDLVRILQGLGLVMQLPPITRGFNIIFKVLPSV